MRWKAIKTRCDMLQELQGLLATIYDVPLVHDVTDFLLTDRRHLPAAFQSTPADEQVLVTEDGSTLWLGVFLEAALLERLASENPLEALHGGNIDPYINKQSPGGPFDSGFFFDSGIGPNGGDSPYMN